MNRSFPRRQEGAALIIGLVLLAVLTVMGISGLGTATLEVAMADNMQRGQYAFQAAESAVHAQMRLAPQDIIVNGLLDGSEVRGEEILSDVPFSFGDAAGTTIANVEVDTSFQGFVGFGVGF